MTTIDKSQLQYESLKLFEKQFNAIEKQVINYIYNKYLNTDNSEVNKTVSINKTENKTPISLKELHRNLLKTEKPRIHTPEKIMKREIKDIQYASDLYEDAPEDYPTGLTEYGYPDSLRCSIIMWRKNVFHRCQKRIKETDENFEYCCLHMHKDNTYEEEYRKEYVKLRKKMIKNNELNDNIY
jgi:hypothetical protein